MYISDIYNPVKRTDLPYVKDRMYMRQ